jgi:hypothetical protein
MLAPTAIVTAQTNGGDRDVVEVPLQELRQIHEELKYLRARDADRQVLEDSIMSRLPATKSELRTMAIPRRRLAGRHIAKSVGELEVTSESKGKAE